MEWMDITEEDYTASKLEDEGSEAWQNENRFNIDKSDDFISVCLSSHFIYINFLLFHSN